MAVWRKLVDWLLGPEEPDEAAASAPKAARSGGAPQAVPDDDDDDEDRLTPEVDRVLDQRYGAPADRWEAPAGGLASAVLRYDVDAPPAHRVWVSRGLRSWRRPHELVVRVRAAAAEDAPVPEWPRALILAIDALTRARDHTIPLGEVLRDLEVEGAPYRHFLMVPDPVLDWIEDPFDHDSGLAFVQVVPLSEARLAETTGDEASRNAALTAWSQNDHLLLVDP